MADYKQFLPLTGEQATASAPQSDVWLGASAGTGKTQVLSARVLRLLLNGAKPESLLCLTFTKTGAAEMAERVHRRLAAWVRAPDKHIRQDLYNLGERNDDVHIANARTLFAQVLDARGAGLRIQTIHSFCQTLLAGFPAEAGLVPGFRPLEERETAQLAHEVLADLVAGAPARGEQVFVERLERLALQLGEDKLRVFLTACARKRRALAAVGSGIETQIRRELLLPAEDVAPLIVQGCADANINRVELEAIRDVNAQWKTSTGRERAAVITQWLQAPPEQRAETLDVLMQVWLKQNLEFRSVTSGVLKIEPDYATLCDAVNRPLSRLVTLRARDVLAKHLADALLVGQRYALAFADAKRAVGGVDFDDLIELTARLLREDGMSAWIKYKLDQATDHILVDEAQDTNSQQWEIIQALAEEFYAGVGTKPGTRRTIFAVGDAKQAIFGFQGTDPAAMLSARDWFDAKAHGAERQLLDVNLGKSYRSSPPILALVDAVVEAVGAEAMGIDAEAPPHVAAFGTAGQVMLLPPIEGDVEQTDSDEAEWVSPATRRLATDIAARVAAWLHDGLWIEDRAKRTTRRLEPRDVMILLRSRGELAPLIVARLHEAGVPVAGIDRLRLKAPLVVRDVLASISFALQPNDDLNLACLLLSPLFGWTQEMLRDIALSRGKTSLWRQLRVEGNEPVVTALTDLLNSGDRLSPARFIEQLLSGPLRGRHKFIERFGSEARDPLDELINAALTFEQSHVASLQGFLDWIERDENDVKRDGAGGMNSVRVMTVHAAKGLQAPLVILADATKNPERRQNRLLDWTLDPHIVPIPRPPAADRLGSVEDAEETAQCREMEEHWRLLYVALTRAEERLVIAGVLGKRAARHELSWHAKVEQALLTLGATSDAEGIISYGTDAPAASAAKVTVPKSLPLVRPAWLDQPAPPEARPPRPLAPSALTNDTSSDPPPSAALRASAVRGRLLHSLFERLPSVAADARFDAADRWLARNGEVPDADVRHALISDALTVIGDPHYADIFGVNALAEAPIAGVVDGVVIAGTVDRLLVTDTQVSVIDFKTARRVPQSAMAIPIAHIRQMAAYVAVLRAVFPQHDVTAALLYTSGPRLFTLDEAILEAQKPSFQLEQQVLRQGA